MFSLEIFTELLVIGVLLLFGISPLLFLVDAQSREKTGFLPFIDSLESKLPKTFLLLILAYAVGAAGNRLADDFWQAVEDTWERVFRSTVQTKYEAALEKYINAPENAVPPVPSVSSSTPTPSAAPGQVRCGAAPIKGIASITDDDNKRIECLSLAEFVLRERSEATREWLDRRRSYARLMRAALLSALMLLVMMGVYNLYVRKSERKADRKSPSRYVRQHFAAALIFLIIFGAAHWIASAKYWKRVYELYVGLPPPAAVKTKTGDD